MASDAITIYLDIHTHDPHRSEISQGNKDFGVIRKPEICTEVSGQSQRKTQRKIRSEIRFANTLIVLTKGTMFWESMFAQMVPVFIP